MCMDYYCRQQILMLVVEFCIKVGSRGCSREFVFFLFVFCFFFRERDFLARVLS